MRKGQVSNMRILETKKIKTVKVKQNIMEMHQRMSLIENMEIESFINEVGEDNPTYKSLIVDFALGIFLKNRKPVNISFLKYLKNFHKFNISSLLYAVYYLKHSKISTRGDIRTFIYLYFAFNIVSSKYLDDYTLWNKSFIPLWGISLLQVSQLEVFALNNIDYNMTIDREGLEKIIRCIMVSASNSPAIP